MSDDLVSAAWSRRPSSGVSRLGGRQLLLLSARDLVRAAVAEGKPIVALVAPAPAALAGFARAARDAHAPLVVLRPSGLYDEKGPEEARDDAAFIEAALRAAEDVQFGGPLALLKDAPPPLPAERERERLEREIDAGFTGLSLALSAGGARDAAAAASHLCQLELGFEVVPDAEAAQVAVKLLADLRSLGSPASAVRLDGNEVVAPAVQKLGAAVSSGADAPAAELAQRGARLLLADKPFLRALRRSAPHEIWQRIEKFAAEKGATLAQAAARHQRLLRDLPSAAQEKLEALASFEAADLFDAAGASGTGAHLLARVGQMAP